MEVTEVEVHRHPHHEDSDEESHSVYESPPTAIDREHLHLAGSTVANAV